MDRMAAVEEMTWKVLSSFPITESIHAPRSLVANNTFFDRADNTSRAHFEIAVARVLRLKDQNCHRSSTWAREVSGQIRLHL